MTVSIDPRVRARALTPHSGTGVPPATIVLAAICVHLLAAAVIYRDVVTDMYALFAATPRLTVMARGLTRLLATSAFLPPILPALLLLGAALWLRGGASRPEPARWLAFGCAVLALDQLLRAVGVVAAPAPPNLGDALDLQNRLAPGARMVAELIGARPDPVVGYWLSTLTVGAAGVVFAVARALHAGEVAALQPAARRRRRRADGVAAFQAACAANGAYLLLGAVGRVALPVATQLFLELFG